MLKKYLIIATLVLEAVLAERNIRKTNEASYPLQSKVC